MACFDERRSFSVILGPDSGITSNPNGGKFSPLTKKSLQNPRIQHIVNFAILLGALLEKFVELVTIHKINRLF